jgi:putative flippase GtrA
MSPDAPQDNPAPKPSLVSRFMRFLRSSLVGIVATAADFTVLEVCMRLLHLEAGTSKIFAFLVGLSVQFFGNRSFAFHATGGSMRRQVLLFCLVESVALTLNWALFRQLVNRARLPIEIANFLVTFVVYVGFSYPAWRIVFRVRGQPKS